MAGTVLGDLYKSRLTQTAEGGYFISTAHKRTKVKQHPQSQTQPMSSCLWNLNTELRGSRAHVRPQKSTSYALRYQIPLWQQF